MTDLESMSSRRLWIGSPGRFRFRSLISSCSLWKESNRDEPPQNEKMMIIWGCKSSNMAAEQEPLKARSSCILLTSAEL